uniref:LOW QUALITY PROTEIN: uncharacterized protein LOC117695961 n=1 Tax=Arvicanthis niloticus TaxID=61156 RepID=UPI001485FF82|nr:LOW QUALITY PROTEIN: uncharacterized protein LOC117695961 [Arvicanthis niloticus]XP_034348949.1 LOW QUALITY PROTEIN: uncharacterized protein LOC117701240 [Arvicanthis niloticus]
MHTDAQAEVVNVEECPEAGTEVWTPSHSSITPDLNAATSISTGMRTSTSSSSTDISSTTPVSSPTSGQGYVIDPKYMLEPQDRELEVGPEFHLNDSRDEQASPEQGECTEEDVKKPLVEAKISNPKEHVIDEYFACHDASSDDEDSEDKKDPKFQEVIVGQEQGHQKAPEAAPSIPTTALQAVHPEAVVEPTPRKTYQYQRPLIGEKFAQLCGPRVLMTEVYDLNISRSFHDEKHSYPDIEEEDREQEQCEYEFAQCIEMLQNLKYERPGQHQTGQGQGSCVHRSREQVVTVIDDLGSPTMEFFGNDNSQHSQNETHRCWEDPIDCAPPLLHHSSRSCQEMTASHQTLAASCQATLPSCQASFVSCPASLPSCSASAPSCQVSAPRCQSLAVSHQASAPPCQASATSCHASVVSQQVLAASYHQSAMSPHASFDHRRENIPCFLPPGQDHSGSFWAEEDTNPHP